MNKQLHQVIYPISKYFSTVLDFFKSLPNYLPTIFSFSTAIGLQYEANTGQILPNKSLFKLVFFGSTSFSCSTDWGFVDV